MAKLTVESFVELINEDLLWRKKEISDLLFLHNNENSLLILKSAILLMYSHWEGYVKNIAKQYIILISDLDLELNKLGFNFEAIDIKGDIRECFKSSDSLNLINEINSSLKYSIISIMKSLIFFTSNISIRKLFELG